MRQTGSIRSGKRCPLWWSRIRTCVFSVPLLIVSCGTAPQLGVHGQESSSTVRETTHPQAYYYFLQGFLAELNNDGAKALEAYQTGLSFDPDSLFLKFRIAKLHFGLGQMSAAVDMAQQIPVDRITSMTMFLEMAKIFFEAGEHGLALQVLAEGERQFPLEQRLYISHGTLLLTEKDFQQADAVFRALLQHVPESAEAHYYLGIIALETNMKLEAVGHFEQAIALNAFFERAYTKLVELLEEENDSLRAIELIETFLTEVNPTLN